MRASGDAPVNGFILFSPNSGVVSAPLAGRQAQGGHVFSHLIWGDWSGGSRSWARLGHDVTELSGFFVYGEATPSTAKTSGTASYTGRLRGDVSEPGSAIQRGVAYGEFGLSADFGTGALGGWLAISADDTMTTYAFASDFENARILRQSDGLHFHGEIGANYADAYGYVEGYFYGPGASELGGSYELINPGNASTQGILFGWQTASMPVKPVVADGSKRAHISTQLLNGSIFDSAIDIATVPVQGAASVALAAPPEQGGGTVSTSQVYAKNGYSYTSWGKWRANDSTPESYSSGGYWTAGQATLPAVIQKKTGSAVYSGEIIGDHVAGGTRQPAQGSVNLTADFSADRITGEMEFHTATTAMTPAPIDAPIQDSGVFAQFGSDGANGNFGYGVQGNFFGPNAEEVGGSAWASTSEGSYNGVFRAKQ